MFVPLDLLATSDGVEFIGGWDNKLNRPALWSWPRRPEGAKEARPAEPLRVRPGPIRLASLAASRDGQTLAVATRGGKRAPWEQRAVIRLIDAKSEDDRAILLDHTDWALDLAFDATGKELMSASKDGTVRSWKLP
jgi:WD40 repeat protein